jgi:pyridinium-3,5-bisthiocarboxylic acid mononucleotide nickel chelatase
MTRLLHIDAVAGVAGDMLLGALLHAGASQEAVRAGLRPLRVDVVTTRTERHGIGATRVEVVAPHEHVHRTWADVRVLVDEAGLPDRAHARAHEAFRRLAEAEGAIHGVPADEVHFHEVGAIDALADVCGVALALEDLGIDEVSCSSLPAPHGFVRAAHGRLPLPAPATLELLKGAPVHGVDLDVELVTPTGAALVAALAPTFGPLPAMTLEATGYGAGSRDLHERPNVVRAIVGVAAGRGEGPAKRPATLLACNLDDLSPELVPDAALACTDAGALDVWVAPVQMKKGRPGMVLSAIARPDREAAVAEAMLRSTSTLGVRTTAVHRYELEREIRTVDVDGRAVAVKLGRLGGEVVNVAPEHDDVARAAQALGRPVKAVWGEAFAAAQRALDG